MSRDCGEVVRRRIEGHLVPGSSDSCQRFGTAQSSRDSRSDATVGTEPPKSRLPGDEMACRLHEMRTGIAGQLVPQERWHQCEGRKPREREESHADVGFAARDVSSGVRRRELGVQIDEEIETDFVGRDLSQGVEILVDVHELLRLDVEAGLLVTLAAHAPGEALPEFEMASAKRITLTSSTACRLPTQQVRDV